MDYPLGIILVGTAYGVTPPPPFEGSVPLISTICYVTCSIVSTALIDSMSPAKGKVGGKT